MEEIYNVDNFLFSADKKFYFIYFLQTWNIVIMQGGYSFRYLGSKVWLLLSVV